MGVPDAIAASFERFVAHAVWKAAWAEDDQLATQEGLEAGSDPDVTVNLSRFFAAVCEVFCFQKCCTFFGSF